MLAALLMAPCARAESVEPPVELAWHAPSGCPRSGVVLERIEALVGSSKTSDTPLRAEATIRRTGSGFSLKLVVRWANLVDERNIDATSCDALAGAAAVNIALLLRSSEPIDASPRASGPGGAPTTVAGDATTTAPSPVQSGPAAAAPPLRAASEPAPAPASSEAAEESSPTGVRGFIHVPFASLALGPLPGPSLGAAVGGGISFDAFRLIADATLRLRRRLTLEERPTVGARIDRFDARVRGCRSFVFGRAELAPCLQLSVSHLWARGTGAYVRAETAEATWVGAGGGGQVRFHLADWLGVCAAVDARFETSRPRLSVGGAGRLERLGPVTVDFSAGLEWIL